MKSLRALVVLCCLALAATFAPALSAHAAVSQKGTFHPLAAARILDTRTGQGSSGPLLGGHSLDLTVAGQQSIPSTGVAAVVINLTVTQATAGGFLTAYATGQSRPTVSSINYAQGRTRANIATLPLGSGGKVTIYNSSGSVSVLADVLGWYASDETSTGGSEFNTTTPERLVDTRADSEGALAAQEKLTAFVDFGDNGSLSSTVRAVALNVTAVGAKSSGYLTMWDGNGATPKASTLNYNTADGPTANMAIVKTALCTSGCDAPPPVQFAVFNGGGQPVHVLIDLVGVYYQDGTTGLRFSPRTPVRISDSRKSLNGKPLTANSTQTLTAPSTVAGATTAALVSNVTAIRPSTSTWLGFTVGGSSGKPTVSNLNVGTGAIYGNGAILELSTTNTVNLYNAAGTGDFTIDVTGRFDVPSGAAPLRVETAHRAYTATTTGTSRQLAPRR